MFIPVSGEFGMGEYARALAIADGARERWPDAAIHFFVSRRAPYAARCPYPATLLDASPTFHSGAVIEMIGHWHPDVVIFDNAGRTAQLRAVRRAGARVVYVSARPRQRRRAFRLSWMRLIDEHWIAYPEFIAGSLGWSERLKLRLMGRPRVRYLDVVLARAGTGPDATRGMAPPVAGLTRPYVLIVPGGGTGHPADRDAPGRFLDAARRVALAGIPIVYAGGSDDAGGAPSPPGLRVAGRVPQGELAVLMRGARLIVANGGSTLMQAIASGKPSIGVPVAGDQAERIRRCVDAGVAASAPLDAAAIAGTASDLWRDDTRRDALAARATGAGLADGVAIAVQALEAWFP